MKSKTLNRRELLVLSLPLFIFFVVAVLLKVSEKNRVESENGPLRTAITNIKVEEVTPFEAWQGFSHRVTIEAELQGKKELPKGFIESQLQAQLNSDVSIYGKIAGQDKKIEVGKRIKEKWNIYDVDDSPLVSVYNWDSVKIRGFRTFLIRSKSFDAGTINLRGTIQLHQIAKVIKNTSPALPKGWQPAYSRRIINFIQRPALPTNFDINISVPEDPRVDKTSPEIIASGKTSFSPRSSKIGASKSEGETQVWVSLKPFTGFTGDKEKLFVGPTDIIAENDQPVSLLQNQRGRQSTIRFTEAVTFGDGTRELKTNIPVWNIPDSYGALTYRTWISFGDSWPVEVRIPVRTRKEMKKPSLLTLDSIKVNNAGVSVIVKYWGSLKLTDGNSDGHFDNRSERFGFPSQPNQISEDKRKPDEDRLISNWSQHITKSNGKQYWSENAVKVLGVTEIAPKTYDIFYSIDAMNDLKTGEIIKFSAHVGTEGDGFIPIEAKITKNY